VASAFCAAGVVHSDAAPHGYNKHKKFCSHATGNLRKIQPVVLTLSIGLLFLGQWSNSWEDTSATAIRMEEPDFCHDNCKNHAKVRQVGQGPV
jgi:hypothetical protein